MPQVKTNITFKLGHESFIRVFRTIIKWILFQFHSNWLCRLWVTDISRGGFVDKVGNRAKERGEG